MRMVPKVDHLDGQNQETHGNSDPETPWCWMYIEVAQALNAGFPEIFGSRWSQTSQALQHHAMQGGLNMPSTAELTPKCKCSNIAIEQMSRMVYPLVI